MNIYTRKAVEVGAGAGIRVKLELCKMSLYISLVRYMVLWLGRMVYRKAQFMLSYR